MKPSTALRVLREKRGETVSSMAEKLEIGVSRYFMIEKGERPATPSLAEQIALILEVSTCEIFLPQSFTVRDIDCVDRNQTGLSS